MKYVERLPSAALVHVVECYWYLEGTGTGEPEWILPDGRAELVFHLGSSFTRHLPDGRAARQERALLAGQMLSPIGLSCTGTARVVGIRLRPAALGALCRVPAGRLTGRIVPAADVLPGTGALGERLECVIHRDGFGDAACAQLESFLLAMEPEVPDAMASVSCARIIGSGGRWPVEQLCGHLGVSRRRLERVFVREVGVTPKAFGRLARFQRAARAIRAGAPLADAAALCGYYDQAHMALDFRQLSDASPTAWQKAPQELAAAFLGEPTGNART